MNLISWLREWLSAERRRTRQPRLRSLLVLALAGSLGIGGVLAWRGTSPSARSSSPRNRLTDLVAANGLVEGASREIALFPEVSGTLALLQARVGDEVQAETVLFELHNETQKAQVALAEAELASAQAQLQQAKADWERSREIKRVQPGAISTQAHEAERTRWLVGQARVQEAEARLGLARAELAKTRVKAPVSGRVLQTHYEVGTLIEPRRNVDPVVRMADVSRRRVRAWVEELNVAQVAVGQPAVVTADGFPKQEFTGKVIEVAGRMGQDAPRSQRPGERDDVYYRQVVIELDGGLELPLNLRVDVLIKVGPAAVKPVPGPSAY